MEVGFAGFTVPDFFFNQTDHDVDVQTGPNASLQELPNATDVTDHNDEDDHSFMQTASATAKKGDACIGCNVPDLSNRTDPDQVDQNEPSASLLGRLSKNTDMITDEPDYDTLVRLPLPIMFIQGDGLAGVSAPYLFNQIDHDKVAHNEPTAFLMGRRLGDDANIVTDDPDDGSTVHESLERVTILLDKLVSALT